MNKQKLTPAERIAALEEQKDRLADRSALSGQIEACVKSRDDLADRLNRVIAVAEWRRSRNRKYEYQIAALRDEVTELEAQIVKLAKRQVYQFEANPGMKGAKAYLFVIADSKEEALDFLNQHELDFLYVFGQSDIIAEGNDKGVFETIYLNK